MIAHYLEEKMKCPVYLIYESRWPGPPADRPDPFTLDHVDIGMKTYDNGTNQTCFNPLPTGTGWSL